MTKTMFSLIIIVALGIFVDKVTVLPLTCFIYLNFTVHNPSNYLIIQKRDLHIILHLLLQYSTLLLKNTLLVFV